MVWSPIVCETRSQTSSTALKPASWKRARIVSAGSEEAEIRPSGAAWEAFERPARNGT